MKLAKRINLHHPPDDGWNYQNYIHTYIVHVPYFEHRTRIWIWLWIDGRWLQTRPNITVFRLKKGRHAVLLLFGWVCNGTCSVSTPSLMCNQWKNLGRVEGSDFFKPFFGQKSENLDSVFIVWYKMQRCKYKIGF